MTWNHNCHPLSNIFVATKEQPLSHHSPLITFLFSSLVRAKDFLSFVLFFLFCVTPVRLAVYLYSKALLSCYDNSYTYHELGNYDSLLQNPVRQYAPFLYPYFSFEDRLCSIYIFYPFIEVLYLLSVEIRSSMQHSETLKQRSAYYINMQVSYLHFKE